MSSRPGSGPRGERLIKASAVVIFLYTVVVSLPGLLSPDLEWSKGVFSGGAIAFLNFLWQASLVRRLLEKKKGGVGLALKFAFKELFILGLVGALVAYHLLAAVPFLVGLSGLLAGVVAAMVLHGWGLKRRALS